MPAEPPGFFLATRNAINSSKKFIYQLANTLHKQQKANGQWALIKDPLQIETHWQIKVTPRARLAPCSAKLCGTGLAEEQWAARERGQAR